MQFSYRCPAAAEAVIRASCKANQLRVYVEQFSSGPSSRSSFKGGSGFFKINFSKVIYAVYLRNPLNEVRF